MQKHLITLQDLENNPLLNELGLKAGDTLKYSVDNTDETDEILVVTFDGYEEGGSDTKEEGGHDPIPPDPIKP